MESCIDNRKIAIFSFVEQKIASLKRMANVDVYIQIHCFSKGQIFIL